MFIKYLIIIIKKKKYFESLSFLPPPPSALFDDFFMDCSFLWKNTIYVSCEITQNPRLLSTTWFPLGGQDGTIVSKCVCVCVCSATV